MPVSQWPEISLPCKHGHGSPTTAGPSSKVDCRVCKSGACPECGTSGRRVALWVPARRPESASPPAVDRDQAPAAVDPAGLPCRWEREELWAGTLITRPGRAGDACGCSALLLWEPGRTLVFCESCGKISQPAAIGRHYARQVDRTAGTAPRGQDDRDGAEEEKELYAYRRELADQLGVFTADDNLTSRARGILEWYAEKVRKAVSREQLDDLVRQFGEDRAAGKLNRRKWWQGRPGELESADDDYEDDDDPGPARGQVAGTVVAIKPAAELATPASIAAQQYRAQPQRMDWATGIRLFGWRLSQSTGDGCQVIDEFGRLCGAGTMHHIGVAWLCSAHYLKLGGFISEHNRRIS